MDPMVTMRPCRRAIMLRATAWQVRMVLSRLRSSTARTSASLILTASFGSGLPPAAAMSPPALWIRISIGPSFCAVVSTTRSMSAPFVRSPRTLMVRTPCSAATASATAVRVEPSPYSAGPFSRMPWMATSAPRLASRRAKARPRPRPAPVTSATLPTSDRAASSDVMLFSLMWKFHSAAGSRPMARACTRHIGATRVRSASGRAGRFEAGISGQASRLDFTNQLDCCPREAVVGDIKREHGMQALAVVQHLGVRAMRGDVAEKLFQLFALGDQVRWIENRPGQQERCFAMNDAGKRRPLLIFAGVHAKIGLFRIARVGAQAINPGHQHHAGDAGTAQLEFRMGQIARDVRRAGGVADGDDLVAISPEQIDVLVDRRDRRRDIFCAAGPGVVRRQPIGHSHADHCVARR